MVSVKELQELALVRVARQLEGQRDITDEQIKESASHIITETLNGSYLSVNDRLSCVNHVLNAMKKLGVLQPLLEDPTITEIMINGPDHIFVERSGFLSQVDTKFESRKQLEDTIQRIVAKVDRKVDTANPICDARLEDGSRVNIVLAPVALNGPVVTIRKFSDTVIQFDDLVSWGAITREAATFLQMCVKAKYNIFVSGGTGSGKTTFLNALSNFIPGDERIITIEDSAELQIQGIANLVRMETRNANAEGKGAISIRDLIKSSLRMRPERIVVGEVRGAEALDMLQAMNTGHDGSLSTGHANSPVDMLSRLETMVLGGASFPIEAIRQQIASALNIVVHLGRMSDKSRKTLEIVEIVGYENGAYILNPLFTYIKEGEGVNRKILGSLHRTGNPMRHMQKFDMSGIPCRINEGMT